MNLKQREKKWAELSVSQNDTSQLSSDAKDYLAGLLGKERGEATNSSHIGDKNEDDKDHDDVAWSEEQDESDDDDCSVSVLSKPGEASLTDIEDYGPYWNNSSVHTIPGSSFRLNFEYLRFSWFILLGFLFFSSCFSLIVSFVFKPPDIKIFSEKTDNNIVIFW